MDVRMVMDVREVMDVVIMIGAHEAVSVSISSQLRISCISG